MDTIAVLTGVGFRTRDTVGTGTGRPLGIHPKIGRGEAAEVGATAVRNVRHHLGPAIAQRQDWRAGLAPTSGAIHHQMGWQRLLLGLKLADDRSRRLTSWDTAGQGDGGADARGGGAEDRIRAEDGHVALVLAKGG